MYKQEHDTRVYFNFEFENVEYSVFNYKVNVQTGTLASG